MLRTSLPIASAACLLSTSALAQDARFRLDPVHPASAHSPFLVVEGPTPKPPSTPSLAASLIADYALHPLRLDVVEPDGDKHTENLVDHALVTHLNAAAFLTESLAVDASWSIAAPQLGSDVTAGSSKVETPASTAPGDVRAGALFRGRLSDHLGHVLGVRAWAPTGDEKAYMSDDRFRFELLAGLAANPEPVRLGCTLFGSPLWSTKKSGERVGAGCAADLRLSAGGPSVGAELWGAARYVDPDSDLGSIFEYMVTAGQESGPIRFTFGVGRGAGNAPGNAALRLVGSVAYVAANNDREPERKAKAADRDLDGIADAIDACPDEAGPVSELSRHHGCPVLDSDGDGIVDENDACPSERGAKRDEPDESGCPDRDNDRVVDKLDRCPDEPAPPYDAASRGCPKHARVQGDKFVISPALSPLGAGIGVDQIILREVAFILRATPSITKVAVEVRLPVTTDEDEVEVAALASSRADAFVQRLVRLGVERERLDPVGALSSDKSEVRVVIVERSDKAR